MAARPEAVRARRAGAREAADANSVYQVRCHEVLTADDITSAVTEYADLQPPEVGGEKPARRFAVHRYVPFTSAEFEAETGEAR